MMFQIVRSASADALIVAKDVVRSEHLSQK